MVWDQGWGTRPTPWPCPLGSASAQCHWDGPCCMCPGDSSSLLPGFHPQAPLWACWAQASGPPDAGQLLLRNEQNLHKPWSPGEGDLAAVTLQGPGRDSEEPMATHTPGVSDGRLLLLQTPRGSQTPLRWRRCGRRCTRHWRPTANTSTPSSLGGEPPAQPASSGLRPFISVLLGLGCWLLLLVLAL